MAEEGAGWSFEVRIGYARHTDQITQGTNIVKAPDTVFALLQDNGQQCGGIAATA